MKPGKTSLALSLVFAATSVLAQNKYFADWPAGTAPTEVGKRVAERFIPTPHMEMNSHGPQALHYSHVATWTGALQFAALTKDTDLKTKLVDRFDPFFALNGSRVPRADHVDGTVFGALPLELYMQDARFRFRLMGLTFADAQWDQPLPDGLSRQTRWWIDDMYMITALQLAAYRATGDSKYLERATQSDGRVPRQAAAAERPLLSRARRAVLLGPRRWLGGRGHGRPAARAARRSTSRARSCSPPIAR